MTQLKVNVPKAFVSYSWENEKHRTWVLNLASRLRHDGVAVILDQWHVSPGEQLTLFMERAVRGNDFVLIICTPSYKEKSNGRTGGVGYEGDIMTGEILTARNDKKFIPILRKGEWIEAAPSWLLSKVYIDLRGAKYAEHNYRDLLRTLHRQKPIAPPIGSNPIKGALTRTKSVAPREITKRAKELLVEILGNTYRRAFYLNFTTRFARADDYIRVLHSIHQCHSFLQRRMVRVMVNCPKSISNIVLDMLTQVECMDSVFRKMEPYTRGARSKETDDYLEGRLDGSGQPELMRAFVEMEKVRIEFLINNNKLAKAASITLPPAPITQNRVGVPFGADWFLEPDQLTIKDLQKASNEFRRRRSAFSNE